jgi:hypothetical protein
MFTFTTPQHSFVPIPCPVDTSCDQDFSACLPILSATDVRFQVHVTTDEYFYLFARIVTTCGGTFPNVNNDLVRQQFTITDITVGEAAQREYVCNLNALFQSDLDAIQCGQCCYIELYKRVFADSRMLPPYTDTQIGCSCCFVKICDPCDTTLVQYRSDEDSFGFEYHHTNPPSATNVLASYLNAVRLPIMPRFPQYPTTRNVFVKSNGERKKLSARVSKEYTVQVDWIPKSWGENLVMACEHDTIRFTNTNEGLVNQSVSVESTPEFEYFERPGYMYPFGRATFKIQITPFNNFNSNC